MILPGWTHSPENSCPDYVFYLAETLVVIDHQAKTTELIGNVFNGPDVHANCFEVGQQLERLNAVCDKAKSYQGQKQTGSNPISVDVTTSNTANMSSN